MTLDAKTISGLAEHLESCQLEARDTVKITDEHPSMDWHDAYAIQAEILRRKLTRGERLVGLKCGLTSHAKMKQMGVTAPVFGFLTESFAVNDGGEIPIKELIHPKVEPELCFVTRRALRGPGCHIGAVLASIDFVLPGIEVIDSRYRDFKFDLKSVIADNTSAARFVVGGRAVAAHRLDLRTLGLVLEKNGQAVALGAGAAILGHPAAAVAMLANHLGQRGEEIPAGTLIFAGAATEAVTVDKGDHICLRVQDLGSVSLRFI